MHAAYLAIAAKRRRPLAPHHHALVATSDNVSGLYFTPRHHLSWKDDSNRLVLGGWQQEVSDADPQQWHVDAGGIAMYTGAPRWPTSSAGDRAVAQTLAALDVDAFATETEPLSGVFSAVSLRRDGRGCVVTDPLAQRFVYYGETNDVFVVSSQASLVAQALAADGVPPRRDLINTCALAYHETRIGDRCGFEGVHVLPPGGVIELKANQTSYVRRRLLPWLDLGGLRDASRQELLEMGQAHVLSSVAAVAASADCDDIVDLTGGKDTRLVLAAILAAGLEDRCRFETVGPPDLADVQVACEIAPRFGLDHHARFELPDERPDFGEVVRDFVRNTAGICSIWEARPAPSRRPGVRISGMNGECLRAPQVVTERPRTADELAQLVGTRVRPGQLELIRPDVRVQFDRSVQELLVADPLGGSPPLDLLDTFHFQTTGRKRYGPLDDLQAQPRVLPLYSLTAVRIAFALGGEARQQALIHFEVIRAASDELAKHPFAGAGWSECLLSAIPDGDAYRPPPRPDDGSLAPEPLMARLHRSIRDDQRAVLHDVLLERDNPAWEVIDRGRAQAALADYESLTNTARKEIFGAVTAALWLGDHVPI